MNEAEELELLRKYFRKTWKSDRFASRLMSLVVNEEITGPEAVRRIDSDTGVKLGLFYGIDTQSWVDGLKASALECG